MPPELSPLGLGRPTSAEGGSAGRVVSEAGNGSWTGGSLADAPRAHGSADRRSLEHGAGRNGKAEAAAHASPLYGDLSRVYDLIFARVFYPRIARVIRQLQLPPASRVLEIGVGTGLSLSAYPRDVQVVGLDVSADMLKHAQRKIDRLRLGHIRLVEGDALALPFPAESFDFVMAFHVITVVPNHERLLEEARRVLRPGGMLVVINHFRSASRWLNDLERRLEPVSRRWGWSTLDVGEATAHMGDPRLHRRGARRGALFTILVAQPQLAEPKVAELPGAPPTVGPGPASATHEEALL